MRAVLAAIACLFVAMAAYAQSPVLTFYGTVALSAGVSTNMNAANTQLGPTSGSIPANLYWLSLINTGSNPVVVCWKGGNCTATNGGETLAPGAGDRVNLNGQTAVPTLFSTAGSSVAVHD